jgi:hypothetical protein
MRPIDFFHSNFFLSFPFWLIKIVEKNPQYFWPCFSAFEDKRNNNNEMRHKQISFSFCAPFSLLLPLRKLTLTHKAEQNRMEWKRLKGGK